MIIWLETIVRPLPKYSRAARRGFLTPNNSDQFDFLRRLPVRSQRCIVGKTRGAQRLSPKNRLRQRRPNIVYPDFDRVARAESQPRLMTFCVRAVQKTDAAIFEWIDKERIVFLRRQKVVGSSPE